MKLPCLVLSIALLTGGCSEYVPFASGALEGQLTPVPENWQAVEQAEIIELETLPEEPYSVKLWIVHLAPYMYVHAGASRTTWVENMEADSRVRLLIEGKIYELRAERVTGQEEFNRFAGVYEQKYGNRPRNENVNEAYLFRLLPREG